MSNRRDSNELLLPSSELKEHVDNILNHLDGGQAQFVLEDRNADYRIELNEDIYNLLRCVLIDLSQNRAVQILPRDMIFTTVQAAEFLQVSRPHLVKLIDEGIIAHQMVGTHRRVKLEDLIKYKRDSEKRGKKAREDLTKLAEELGLGY